MNKLAFYKVTETFLQKFFSKPNVPKFYYGYLEYHIIKTSIIRYYLLLNSIGLKLRNQKYDDVPEQK